MYSVEIQIMRREIEQAGKDKAIQRATELAWMRTIREMRPRRSVVLIETEIDEYLPLGPHAYRYRFRFAIDQEV